MGTADVVVVGGGLSGLHLAHELVTRHTGLKVVLLEASALVGGRLASKEGVDLGAAWVWSQSNPLVAGLARALSIPLLRQGGAGPGQYRAQGSMASIANTLASSATSSGLSIKTTHPVSNITANPNFIEVQCSNGATWQAKAVAVCVPPRVGLKTIKFVPDLSETKKAAMRRTPAWMSKVSKVAMVYSKQWWGSEQVFGGARTRGPAFQYYDVIEASGLTAIVAFCEGSRMSDSQLEAKVLAQTRAFLGPEVDGKLLKRVVSHRWESDPFINEDPNDLHMFHLSPNSALGSAEAEGRIVFAGTEAAPRSPGFLEGAVEASVAAVAKIEKVLGV